MALRVSKKYVFRDHHQCRNRAFYDMFYLEIGHDCFYWFFVGGKNGPFSASLFNSIFEQINRKFVHYNFLPMNEFQPQTSGIGSDHSANRATATAFFCTLQKKYLYSLAPMALMYWKKLRNRPWWLFSVNKAASNLLKCRTDIQDWISYRIIRIM